MWKAGGQFIPLLLEVNVRTTTLELTRNGRNKKGLTIQSKTIKENQINRVEEGPNDSVSVGLAAGKETVVSQPMCEVFESKYNDSQQTGRFIVIIIQVSDFYFHALWGSSWRWLPSYLEGRHREV